MKLKITKKNILLIPTVILAAIGIVVLLAWRSFQPLKGSEKFNRIFLKTAITIKGVMKSENVMRLSGSTPTHLFFQTKNPSKLLMADYSLNNIDTIKLDIPVNEMIESSFSTYIDSPHVSVMAGRISAIFENDISNNTQIELKLPTTLFTRGIMVGTNKYVVRGVDTFVKRFDQIFLRANSANGKIKRETNISETNKDGGLSTDGMLTYNRLNNLVFYSEFYSRNIFCIDSGMNLKYSFHTIDNTKTIPITATINKNVLTANTPKRLVNTYCATDNDILCVYSAVKAENEKDQDHTNNSSIDKYDIKNGKYVGSFYIPKYAQEKMKRFSIVGNNIISFYKSHVVVYNLSNL